MLKQKVIVSSLLLLEGIANTAVQGSEVHDISKYLKGQQVVYIKDVFLPNIKNSEFGKVTLYLSVEV